MQSHKFALRFTTGLLLSAMLVTPALALQGTVDTDGGALNVRSEIGTNSKVLAQLEDQTQLEILDAFFVEGQAHKWYQISCNGVKGYVSGEFVDIPGVDSAAVEEARYVKVTTDTLNVRTGPGTDYDKAGKLYGGRVVKVLGESNGWLQIENGYISAEFTTPSTAAEAVKAPSSKGQEVVDYAMGFLGSRYVYGGSSPSGFDCSGFTKYVYKHFGYDLNRSASAQLKNGVSVPKSDLQPGDLVMFRKSGSKKAASHVGLYIGNNQFIHASTSNTGVIISDLDSSYYTKGFVDARRIIK